MQDSQTLFCWRGQNSDGSIVYGEMFASCAAVIHHQLQAKKISPISIQKKAQSFIHVLKNRITSRDITFIIHQLAVLVSAGIPIIESLHYIASSVKKTKLKALLLQVKNNIEKGASLNTALSRHPQYFPQFFIALITMAENAGLLDQMLLMIADERKKIERLKRNIYKAIFYPITVLTIAIIMTACILIFIVPKFEAIYQQFGASIPLTTQIVIDSSYFLRSALWVLLPLFFLFGYIIRILKARWKSFNVIIDKTKLKLPLIRHLTQKAMIARFSRLLAMTYEAGIPLTSSLELVADSLGNLIYAKAISNSAKTIKTGFSLQEALSKTTLFTPEMIQMIAMGETSGKLAAMLYYIADDHEQQIDVVVSVMSSLLEPVMMVILGMLIGGIIIAMYLPIFKLGTIM